MTSDKIGDRKIRSVSPIGADKIYGVILAGPDGERPRQAEKAVALCRRAWRVVHRLHPGEFDRVVPNPWNGVTMQRRVKNRKPAVAREDVYKFAFGSDQIRTPGSRRGGGYLFRVATAPRKRAGRCAAMVRLPKQGMADRCQNFASQDRGDRFLGERDGL